MLSQAQILGWGGICAYKKKFFVCNIRFHYNRKTKFFVYNKYIHVYSTLPGGLSKQYALDK